MKNKQPPPRRDPGRSSSPASDRRRRLLTGVFVPGITWSLLPDKWSRPIVQSVLLPAHAQTSIPDDPSFSPCNDIVEIPGCTVTCGAGEEPISDVTYYQVSVDAVGCLVVAEVTLASDPDFAVHCVKEVSPVFELFLLFEVNASTGPTSDAILVFCSSCVTEEANVGPYVLASGLAEVTAQLSVTCEDNPTATISNIVVTKL